MKKLKISGLIIMVLTMVSCLSNQKIDKRISQVGLNNKYNSAFTTVSARDYQIELMEDSLMIFDGSRLVGTIPYNTSDEIGKLIEKDNG